MLDAGLREVANPSEILLTHYEEPLSGIAVGASADGVRPYLIEVQALACGAAYGTPQRTATGFDTRRMNMLLAVLEKRLGMKMYQKDVFLNFAGGFKVSDPGLDLAVAAAVISSYFDRPWPRAFVVQVSWDCRARCVRHLVRNSVSARRPVSDSVASLFRATSARVVQNVPKASRSFRSITSPNFLKFCWRGRNLRFCLFVSISPINGAPVRILCGFR